MSANLARTATSAGFPQIPVQGAGDSGVGGGRALRNTRTGSPLSIFGDAKRKINSAFSNIAAHVADVLEFTKDAFPNVTKKEEVDIVETFKTKVSDIQAVLARDHMKVVFFGRTSNGKSTVINAILHRKILPTGIGHTTNCFVQVEGSSGSHDGYVLTEDSIERKNISSVVDLAGALSTFKLDTNKLVRICWPKENCPLFNHDIVFMDSPGIDFDQDMDSWIDKFCLDADVFVIVGNAESSLNGAEKKFLVKVADKLSKPHVFVLNNRWDASDEEPESREQVYIQHMDRYSDFLCKELKCCSSRREAEDRIFFVSAKEALAARTRSSISPSTPVIGNAEGAKGRLFEFCRFEAKFQDCVSRTAVKTKFAQHTEKGLLIVGQLKDLMEEVADRANTARDRLSEEREEAITRLRKTEKALTQHTDDIKGKIRDIMEGVETQVAVSLNEEIQLLAHIVGAFERPFHSDDYTISVYKRELHTHVEQGLGKSLESKCTSVLSSRVVQARNGMLESLSALLPKDELDRMEPPEPVTISYQLSTNICADFKEDIAFRFSMGLYQMLARLLKKTRNGGGVENTAQGLDAPDQHIMAQGNLAGVLLAGSPGVMSSTSVGAIIVGGLVLRTAGIKIVMVLGGLYAGVYIYERAMWTNKAKERAFKEQYVTYASGQLRRIVDMVGRNVSHQVQQLLASTFVKLSQLVVKEKKKLENTIEALQAEITDLEAVASKAKILKNKATWLGGELSGFASTYLEEA